MRVSRAKRRDYGLSSILAFSHRLIGLKCMSLERSELRRRATLPIEINSNASSSNHFGLVNCDNVLGKRVRRKLILRGM